MAVDFDHKIIRGFMIKVNPAKTVYLLNNICCCRGGDALPQLKRNTCVPDHRNYNREKTASNHPIAQQQITKICFLPPCGSLLLGLFFNPCQELIFWNDHPFPYKDCWEVLCMHQCVRIRPRNAQNCSHILCSE